MTYEAFKTELMDTINDKLNEQNIEGVSIKNEEIMSPDGMTDRLIVNMNGCNISMAFRFQEAWDAYDDDIDSQAASIVETIKRNQRVKAKEPEVKEFITDYERAKHHLMLRLIPGDSPILSETPHKMFEDLALVVNLLLDDMSDDNGIACCIVNNSLMGMYGVMVDELFRVATENSLKQEPVQLTPMRKFIDHMLREGERGMSDFTDGLVYIATNASGWNGSAVLGYPNFLENVSEEIGGSCYLIPSSVHEWIIVKEDLDSPNAECLNKMIHEVNRNSLSPRERLSEHCYHYDAETGVFEIGTEYDERLKNMKQEVS